jgi:hypothetical protein
MWGTRAHWNSVFQRKQNKSFGVQNNHEYVHVFVYMCEVSVKNVYFWGIHYIF